MLRSKAKIVREYGPFPGTDKVKLLRTIDSDRFVTGVAWHEGELWHGTLEGEVSDLRRIDPETGDVRESVAMPAGMAVTGLESNGRDLFFCGGGSSGTVRAV